MKTFDYVTAWGELAFPSWCSLPREARELAMAAAEACKDHHQDATLRQTWPNDGGDLRRAFEAYGGEDLEPLALLALVSNYVGHWKPGFADLRQVADPATVALMLPKFYTESGSHWKVVHLCDQVISETLNRGQSRWNRYGETPQRLTQVHEGVWRICTTTLDSWMWEEVLPASRSMLAALDSFPWPVQPTIGNKKRADWDDWTDRVKAASLRLIEKHWPSTGPWLPWKPTVDRFMVDDDEFKTRQQAAKVSLRQFVDARHAAEVAAKIEAD